MSHFIHSLEFLQVIGSIVLGFLVELSLRIFLNLLLVILFVVFMMFFVSGFDLVELINTSDDASTIIDWE